MRAVLVMTVPFGSGLATVTASVAVPELPGTRLPRFHVTTPPAIEQVAPPQLAYVVLAGTASVMTTVGAGSFPVTAQAME